MDQLVTGLNIDLTIYKERGLSYLGFFHSYLQALYQKVSYFEVINKIKIELTKHLCHEYSSL